jgi:membrane protease YdiL (CAAX protease family)
VLLYVGPLIVVTLVVGWMLGTIDFRRDPAWWLYIVRTYCWSTLQQYGLLAVYYRRLDEILSDARGVILAAASFFAVFHLPNPFLTPVTLLAGALSCWLYKRVPNLWVLGLAHTALSIAITRSLSYEVTFGMRVGPAFLRFLEALRAGGAIS